MSDNLIDLTILRHGQAGEATSDRDRSLTEYGEQQISNQCKWLFDQGFRPELILHSPYQRTIESAVLAQMVFPEAVMQVESSITPNGDPALILSLIPALGKNQILLVSHMPMVANLTRSFNPEFNIFSYPIAGLCWIQMQLNGSLPRLLHQHWPTE